ncbi:terpene synthase family protein [Halocatena halophila]|uniref:terpene synthase family protein n=1 Tax=Halocatena halophila TaxID=2814576 RepID=UPI002ED271CE
MTADAPTGPLEQSVSIDAAPADVFAVLTAVESVLEACSGLTVRTAEEGVTVTDVGPEGTSPSVFTGQVRVTDSEEPTRLTMTFDGAPESTVAWTLQPEGTSTLVTATVTAPDRDRLTGGGNAEATGGESSASDTQLTAPLDNMLGSLQTLCEQPSPPACMFSSEFPEIDIFLTSKMNSHLDAVTAHTRGWAQQMGMFQEEEEPEWFRGVAYGTCRVHPQATLEAVNLCNDWNSWGFVYDDQLDDTELGTQPAAIKAFQQPLLAVFEGDTGQINDPLVRGLADIWNRAATRMSSTGQERFIQHHIDFFAGQRWEARNRAKAQVPPLDVYMEHRRDSVGSGIVFALCEIARDLGLSSSVYNDEDVTILRETAANIFAWTNDIYSLPKELAHDEVNNLVVVIRNEQDCSLQDAVEEAKKMLTAEIQRFESRSQRLPTDSDTDTSLPSYQTVLEQWIQGYLTWCQETSRYQSWTSPS